MLPDKSEKVLGWFRTRDEATHNANIMKEKHERVVAIRLKAKAQMVPSEDEIKNDCSAEGKVGMSEIENLVTPLKGDEKDASKRDIDNEGKPFHSIPSHLPKVNIKTPKNNTPVM